MEGNLRLSAETWIDSRRQLTVVRKELRGTVPLHGHDFFELELVLDGTGTQVYNGQAGALRQGSMYLLTPADMHEVVVHEPLQLYNVMFSGELLPEPLRTQLLSNTPRMPIVVEEEERNLLHGQLELLHREYARSGPLQPLLLQSVLQSLLILYVRAVKQQAKAADATTLTGNSPLQRAILFLQTHFSENPSLGETAAVAGLNRTYFCELFREKMGKSYTAYLNTLKIRYAGRLLRSGNADIQHVCAASGFSSMSNFLRLFRQQMGMSPSQYRKDVPSDLTSRGQ